MKLHIKPSRSASKIALVVSMCLIVFGTGFLVLVGNVLAENQAPMLVHVGFYLFMAFWLGTAISIAVYHARNIRSGQGSNLFEVDGIAEQAACSGPAQKLKDLNELKQDGLISEAEFQLKRAEIMAEHW
ncbi:MAG: SHOCT domain-containing protein [Gallionella sp.]|nr:SHOCT domain-containing protein [Gallionella sp.]